MPIVAFAMVDWHDFVVVETIDLFDEEEDLPPPITAEDLGQELNMQREMHVKEAVLFKGVQMLTFKE